MKQTAHKITGFLGSRAFLWAVFAFFILECVWVALSSAYPMAFDEEYHFGLIKIYAGHALPFLAAQPSDANQFGAVARDPSFLYHWLMSFPYRLVAGATDNQAAQIITLRLLNIGITGASLVLYVRALYRMGMSRAFTNVALAVFVLIPILPLLAGQVNYDSLFMLFVAWITLLTFTLIDQLRAGKVAATTLVCFIAACMLGGLTKYAFLPVAAAAVILLGVVGWRTQRTNLKRLPKRLQADFAGLQPKVKIGLVLFLAIPGILFVQRYGVNMVQYHTPVPDCSAVLSVEACKEYGPWARNYRMATEKTAVDANPLYYTSIWLQGLHYRLFFTVNGPHHNYASYPTVPLPSATFIVLTVMGLAAIALYFRRIFDGATYIKAALVLSLAYIGVLWINNYTDYLQTGWPVAVNGKVNGRYLLPVLLLLAALWGKAIATALQPWPLLKPLAAVIVLALFLQGGGVFSYILRTDDTWYWPNQSIVTTVNDAARRVLDPITFEGPKYY